MNWRLVDLWDFCVYALIPKYTLFHGGLKQEMFSCLLHKITKMLGHCLQFTDNGAAHQRVSWHRH